MQLNCFQEKTVISRTEKLTDTIYRLTFQAANLAQAAKPGQFVMVRVSDGLDPLLRRPFSIHQVTRDAHLQILFKVVGKGTGLLAEKGVGTPLDVVGPLGHGFAKPGPNEQACLVGGGMGIAPLSFLARTLLETREPSELTVLLGAQTREELAPMARDLTDLGLAVKTTTDDGSMGHHGLVTDLLAGLDQDQPRRLSVCGPYPMMKAVARLAKQRNWPCQVSLETMMACGLAACLGCAIPRPDGAGYAHVCKEGPVFDAREVLWL